MTSATTARRSNAGRARVRAEVSAPKSTAYGRSVWRALKDMQKAGPWELGPRVSDRVFKKP